MVSKLQSGDGLIGFTSDELVARWMCGQPVSTFGPNDYPLSQDEIDRIASSDSDRAKFYLPYSSKERENRRLGAQS